MNETQRKRIDHLTAVTAVVLTGILILVSFLPIFKIDLSELEESITAYDPEKGYILISEAFIMSFDKEVEISLIKALPFITDHSRVTTVIRLIVSDIIINQAKKDLYEFELNLILSGSQENEEYIELCEDINAMETERTQLLSIFSEVELKKLQKDLENKESDLTQCIAMPLAIIIAAGTDTPINILEKSDNVELKDQIFIIGSLLLTISLLMFVAVMIISLLRPLFFIVCFLKGLLALLRGWKSNTEHMIVNSVPDILGTFVSLTVIDSLLISLLRNTVDRGIATFLIPILWFVFCILHGISSFFGSKAKELSVAERFKCITSIVCALLLLVAIMIGSTSFETFSNYISNSTMDTEEAARSYITSLIASAIIKTVSLLFTYSFYKDECETIALRNYVTERKYAGILSYGLLTVLGAASLFFVSPEITLLIASTLALIANIVRYIIKTRVNNSLKK